MPPDPVLTASPLDYARCEKDVFLSSVFPEGACTPENATWLYVQVYPMSFACYSLPFKVIGAGHTAFFFSPATKKQ